MTNYKKLQIVYANKIYLDDEIAVDYNLRNTPISQKWVERIQLAQNLEYPIDDPERFYGFGSIDKQITDALQNINSIITDLHQFIQIGYRLDSVWDQDTLNRLHHIFEVEHGLLDRKKVNPKYQLLLSHLNVAIHRCESVARGTYPRHVVTYFGLPKTKLLDDNDYKYFEHTVKFGTIYINYVEIGKTLHDLYIDNDVYINADAFQPFRHYSADFVVKFWNEDNSNLKNCLQTYYTKRSDFFMSIGYTWEQLAKSIGSIPVADLNYTGDIIKDLEVRQFVKAIHFL